MTYQLQAVGIPAGYLPSPAFARSKGNGPKMMADGGDSNFAAKNSVLSELFYLTTGAADLRKDLGLVPVRNLKITKEESRYGQALDNTVFVIYGPFDSLDGVQLNAGNMLDKIKTEGGTATFTSRPGAMLLRAKHYVVVEEDSGNIFADKATLTVKGNGVVAPESFRPAGNMITGTNYFGLTKGTADNLGDTALDIEAKNEYRAAGELSVSIKKELFGRQLAKDDFSFTLTSADHPGFTPVTVKNAADGHALFGPVAYTEKDIDKTYHYTVSEVKRVETGLVNDETKGVFSVTVSDDRQGHLTAAINESFTDEHNGNKVVKTFRNFVRGNLTVKKTVQGNAGDKDKAFTFLIHLDGIESGNVSFAALGKQNEVVFTDGDAKVTLKNGEFVTITGILAGTPYRVTEEEANLNHYVTTANAAEGKVTASKADAEGAVAGFTNEKNTGFIAFTKTLKGNDPTTDTAFPFTVELKNDRGSVDGEYEAEGALTAVTITDGKAEGLLLKGGESLTIKGIPAGTAYRVAETDTKGYAVTLDGGNKSEAEGTVTTSGVTHGFVNKKLLYGDLSVEKKLDAGDNGSKTAALNGKEYEIHLAFTPYASFGDVYHADGTYDAVRVKEDGTEQQESVTIRNDSLTVRLRHDEKLTIKKLYQNLKVSVSETDYTALGFTTRYENAEATVAETPVTATVINKRQVGSLVVSKKTQGNAADANDTFTFTVTLKNENGVAVDRDYPTNKGTARFAGGKYTFTLKNGESLELKDIVVGTSVKVEEAAAFNGLKGKVDLTAFGYTTEPESRAFEGEIAAADDKIEAPFVNTRNAYPVTLEKKLAGNAAHQDKYFRFDIRITAPDGVKPVFGNALTGSFDKLPGTMQATDDITFTEVNGGFEGYLLLKGGQKVTVADLPAGAEVVIKESDAVRAKDGTAESLKFLGYTVAGGEMEATLNQQESILTTNTRDAGALEITNTLMGNGAHFEDDFVYVFTFKDPDGTPANRTFDYIGMRNGAPVTGKLTFVNGVAKAVLRHTDTIKISDILYSTDYHVKQEVPARYGYLTTPDTYEFSGAILRPETRHDYLNERWIGPLTVGKTVGGNRGSATKEFSFVLTLTNPDGTPNTRPLDYVGVGKPDGTLRFDAEGKTSFTLRHDEQIRVPDILKDSKFTLKEEDADLGGYVTEVIGLEEDVMTVDGAEISYINIRNEYGSLVVSKALAGNASDKSASFDFIVTLTNEDGTPFEGELPTQIRAQRSRLAFRGGQAAIRLKGGDSLVIGPMLTGTSYTVTEAPSEYITRAEGDKGVVADNNAVYVAAFQNTRNAASLTIKKQLEETNPDRRGFAFVVTLKENGVPVNRTFATEGASGGKPLTFEDGRAIIYLRGGQSLTILDIQTDNGVKYSVKELTGAEYKAVYASASGELSGDVVCTVSNYLLGDPGAVGFPMNEGDCFN